MRSLTLTLAALALGTAPALAQSTDQPAPAAPKAAAQAADNLTWGKAPPGLPEGAEVARVAPHTHPTDETLEVISGILMVAHGPNMRAAGPATLEAGGKLDLAAGTPHSVTARGITIVEVRSTGPFEIKYLNQADDPRNTGT